MTEKSIKRLGSAAAEVQRVQAVNILLRFARAELAKVEGPNRFDSILRLGFRAGAWTLGKAIREDAWDFLTVAGRQILGAADPAAELKRFLGRHGRPRVDNSVRDYTIASDVHERVDAGASIEDACKTIASVAGLSREAVIKIYYARRAQVLRTQDLSWLDGARKNLSSISPTDLDALEVAEAAGAIRWSLGRP